MVREFLFKQIENKNEQDFRTFFNLLSDYYCEVQKNMGLKISSNAEINEYARGMIAKQGDFDRHLEFFYSSSAIAGFFYAKVDHIGHLGYIKPEYGYIMEFYIIPEYRRKGYGTNMYKHIEDLFKEHNANKIYLTADPITGEPFWMAMGFKFLGEISPENGLKIYEKVLG